VTGGQVGPPADRYSLATIAYEMLTGSIPFDGEGLMEVLYAQVHREPPLPSARNSSLSPQVDAVVMRGLAKDPAARWESCTAFVDALAAALAGKTEPAVARTLVMTPAVASNMPLATPVAGAAAAMPARADAVNPSATVAMPFPTAAQPVAKKKSRKRLYAAVVAGVLVVLLILGVLLIAAARPSLSLSASTVTAGDTVVVNASRLPANQNGEIQLLSTVHTFPFHADSNGNVSVPIVVPRNIGAGDHTVKICWGSSCRASATIHVIEPVAFATPSPGTTPTPSASPSSRPTASPTPGQTPPSSAPARSLALSSGHITRLTGTMSVKGFNYSPSKSVVVTFIQSPATNQNVATAVVGADGTFLTSYKIPTTAVLGPASIRACDVNGCALASMSVTAT
jgi:hypothetical protein